MKLIISLLQKIIYFILFFTIGCSSSISENADTKNKKSSTSYVFDLKQIKERDTLKVITTFSSHSYFLYRGEPMGYDYEMAQRLAEHLDVELEVVVAKDMDEIFDMLNEGKGDIITYNLTVTSSRNEIVDFTLPINFTHQVLVQRKPDNWRDMKLHEIEEELIRNPFKLLDKYIAIRENSSYNDRITNLEDELGGRINRVFVPGEKTTDEIIRLVSNSEYDYTIADHNIANINASYYTNLDINTTVGILQRLAWAVRKTSPDLLKVVNGWIETQRNDTDFYVIYNKYFKNKRAYTARIKSDLYSKQGGKISPYDNLFQEASTQINWDWRFLASQAYQESRFDPKERSWAGALGIMQVMPKTGKSYGYRNLKDPETNIEAGISHLAYLNEFWEEQIADSTERLKFVLASYNAGQYHVQDARKLAEKQGWDPNIWQNNVDSAMLLKSEKKYFNDPVVNYGYCRGEEPVNYVTEIFERFNYYKEFIDDSDVIISEESLVKN